MSGRVHSVLPKQTTRLQQTITSLKQIKVHGKGLQSETGVGPVYFRFLQYGNLTNDIGLCQSFWILKQCCYSGEMSDDAYRPTSIVKVFYILMVPGFQLGCQFSLQAQAGSERRDELGLRDRGQWGQSSSCYCYRYSDTFSRTVADSEPLQGI